MPPPCVATLVDRAAFLREAAAVCRHGGRPSPRVFQAGSGSDQGVCMGPSPRVLRSALAIAMCLGTLAGLSPASAQQLEATRRSLDYAPDPLARSPRLLG